MTQKAGADTIRTIIVEDEGLFRDLLRVSLTQSEHIEVVGDFADGDAALAAAPSLEPRVAILDIELAGGMNGIRLGRLLRQRLPGLGIVLLSNHREPAFLSAIPEREMAGWSYLLKKSVGNVAALQRAIEGAAAGFMVLDPLLTRSESPRLDGRLARLSPRQMDILARMAEGFTNAAIADALRLTQKTVENQINNLYQVLEIDRQDTSVQPRVKAVLTYLRENTLAPGGFTLRS